MGAVPCCFSDKWTQSRDKKRTRRKSNMRGKRSNIIPGQTVHTMRQKTCCATLVGSVLNEKWIQTLLPHWRNRKDKAVGAATQELAAPTFLELLTRTLAQSMATRQAPLHADPSHGADVAKPNGKLSLLHVLCPLWFQENKVIGEIGSPGWRSNAQNGLIRRECWGLGSIPA